MNASTSKKLVNKSAKLIELKKINKSLDTIFEQCDFKKLIQNLTRLIEQTKTVISLRNHDEKNAESNCSENSNEKSFVDDQKFEKLIQKFKTQMRYFIQFEFILRHNVINVKKIRAQKFYSFVVSFYFFDLAEVYVKLVREKYLDATNQLINRLNETNWQRHQIIRKQIEVVTKRSFELNEVAVNDTSFYINNDDLYLIFRFYSTFHDSNIDISVSKIFEYASSHTSFLSNKNESETIRAFAASDEIFAEKLFQCPKSSNMRCWIQHRCAISLSLTNVRRAKFDNNSISLHRISFFEKYEFKNSEKCVLCEMKNFILNVKNSRDLH